LYFLFSVFFSIAQLAAAPTSQSLKLSAHKAQQLPLSGNKEEYLIVELDASQPVQAQILDVQGKVLREFAAQRGTQSLHLLLTGQEQQLALQSSSATTVTVSYSARYQQLQQKDETPEDPLLQPVYAAAKAGQDWQAQWQQLKQRGVPLISKLSDDQYRVTFVYQGAKRNVRLLGGPSNDHDWLTPLSGTDLWYRSYQVPATVRLSYKLAPDVPQINASARAQRVAILASAQRDPLNPSWFPLTAKDSYQQSSVLALPGAPAQPGSEQNVPLSGETFSIEFASKLLANSRRIDIYQSRNYQPGGAGNIRLLAFDGPRYQQQINTPAIVEYLTEKDLIPPTQLILIDPIDNRVRAAELPDNPLFGRMLTEELLPMLDQRFNARFDAEHTVLTGSSFGGLATLQLGWRYPQVFGRLIAKSPSLWWDNRSNTEAQGSYLVTERFLTSPKLPLQIFISAGIYEAAHGGQGNKGILDGSRNLKDVLRAKGYPVMYREYAAGHDYLAWRGVLADGLIALFQPPEANATSQ
jgi:enterochelin esterase-like enzyme